MADVRIGADVVFTNVERVRAFEGVVDQIRSLILRGNVAPGDRLSSQRELASQLGVSRQTLREGLRALESEGLIEIRLGHTGGIFVAVPDGELVGLALGAMMHLRNASRWEIQEYRMEFEPQNAAMAARRATEEDLARLDDLVAALRRSVDDGAEESVLVGLELDLHDAVAASTHNAVRASIMIALSQVTRRAAEELAETFDRDALGLACEAFAALMGAIREGDAGDAAEIMRQSLLWI
jgi:GntR family transcriptional repressor for pyruvate dehydrogenase complex